MITMRCAAVFVAMLALAAVTRPPAHASEELVQVASARGGVAGLRDNHPLLSYLLRPDGPAPRPAMVVLR
jgi:hypothetical protein